MTAKKKDKFPTRETPYAPLSDVKYTDMSRDEFVGLPEWLGQRDTAKHAMKLMRVSTWDPQAMALGVGGAVVTYDGVMYRMNANSRVWLYKRNLCALPLTIKVVNHGVVHSVEDGNTIYSMYDPTFIVKGANDRMVTVLRSLDIDLQSKFFTGGKGTSGISIALHALHGRCRNDAPREDRMLRMVEKIVPALQAIDKLWIEHGAAATGTGANTGVVAALILSYFKNASTINGFKRWSDFWSSFYTSRGKIGEIGAPHNKAWREAERISDRKGGSRDAQLQTTASVLACFERKRGPIKSVVPVRHLEQYFAPWAPKPGKRRSERARGVGTEV